MEQMETRSLRLRQGLGKRGICGTEEYLEDKQDQQQNKDPPVQEQRPECATICGGIMESYQKHMPDAGSFPKQVPQEDTANLLAEQNLQHGTP